MSIRLRFALLPVWIAALLTLGLHSTARAQQALYVGTDPDSISKVAPDGTVTPFIAGIPNPRGMAYDTAGNLYVAELRNGDEAGPTTIRKIDVNKNITTLAVLEGFIGDLTFDKQGNLYAAQYAVGGEFGKKISKITPDGTVHPFATGLVGPCAMAFDRDGNMYVGNYGDGTVKMLRPDGTIGAVMEGFNLPIGLVFDANWDLFVSETGSVAGRGLINKYTFSAPGIPSSRVDYARDGGLSRPTRLSIGNDGLLYVANYANNTISKVDASGTVSLFATLAHSPQTITFGSAAVGTQRNLYASLNTASGSIVEIAPDGTVTSFIGIPTPRGIAFDKAGTMYVAELTSGDEAGPTTIRRIDANKNITTFAVLDGFVFDIVFDAQGNLYAGHYAVRYGVFGNKISKITPDGTVGVFATGLNGPTSMAFDAFDATGTGTGNLYVGNYGDGTVKMVTPDGTVSFVGGGFNIPGGLVFDKTGNLYVSETGGTAGRGSIYKYSFSAPGVISTGVVLARDNGLDRPLSIAIGDDGALYVANIGGSNTISKVDPAGVVSTFATMAGYPGEIAFGPSSLGPIVPNEPTDKTPPTTTATLSGTVGTEDWYRSSVQVTLDATDTDSGVDVTRYRVDGGAEQVYNGPFTVTIEGAHNVSFRSTDIDGNVEAEKTVAVKIDKTAPVLDQSQQVANAFVLNGSGTVSFTPSDALSGVASQSVGALNLSSVGSKSVPCTATDKAGNPATFAIPYTVSYGVAVLFDETKAHKSGSIVPIRLQLVDANGVNVSSPSITVNYGRIVRVSTTAGSSVEELYAVADTDFVYTGGGYRFNLSTKGYPTGTYRLEFTASGDPNPNKVHFQVK